MFCLNVLFSQRSIFINQIVQSHNAIIIDNHNCYRTDRDHQSHFLTNMKNLDN